MGDVIELKTKRVLGRDSMSLNDFVDGHYNYEHQVKPETMEVRSSVVWQWVDEINKVQNMTLWDRIFNWPWDKK